MDKKMFQRRVVLASGLIGAVYASFFRPEDTQAYQTVPVAAVQQQPLVTVSRPPEAPGEPGEDGEGRSGDPFAPRGWSAPPPPQEPVKVVTAAPPVAAIVVAEGPPPLPFQFMGRMTDGDEQVVYLGRGDQVVIARAGEALDSTYKVLSVGASRVEFEHVPTGQKQSLAIAVREN